MGIDLLGSAYVFGLVLVYSVWSDSAGRLWKHKMEIMTIFVSTSIGGLFAIGGIVVSFYLQNRFVTKDERARRAELEFEDAFKFTRTAEKTMRIILEILAGLSSHTTSQKRSHALHAHMDDLSKQFDDMSVIPPMSSEEILAQWGILCEKYTGAYYYVVTFLQSPEFKNRRGLSKAELLTARLEFLRKVQGGSVDGYRDAFGKTEEAREAFDRCTDVMLHIANMRKAIREEVLKA